MPALVAQPAGAAPTPVAPFASPPEVATSPWVRDRASAAEKTPVLPTVDIAARHDTGLLQRGVHTTLED